jgi:hypothetical protein
MNINIESKHVKKLFYFLSVSFFLFACGNKKENNNSVTDSSVKTDSTPASYSSQTIPKDSSENNNHHAINPDSLTWETQTDEGVGSDNNLAEIDTIHYKWKGSDKTVLGYFLNVPVKYITNDGPDQAETKAFTEKYRRSLIDKKNSKPGYLDIEPRGDHYSWEGWLDVALFHDSISGDTLFSMFRYECGPGCAMDYRFLNYKNGKWTDVTDSVFDLDAQVPYPTVRKRYESVTHKKWDDRDMEQPIFTFNPEENIIVLAIGDKASEEKYVPLFNLKFANGKFVLVN